MKGKIWILIVILLIAAIGVGAGAGIWISNGINQKEQQEAAEDRDNRIEPIESEKLAEESSEKGCTEESKNTLYLRPETAQGIFVNFANIQRTTRRKVP